MDSKTNIQQLKDLIGELNINFPSSSSDKLSYLQELQYLTYAINKCVETINLIDPENIDETITQFKADILDLQTRLTQAEKDIEINDKDITTIQGQILTINNSILSLQTKVTSLDKEVDALQESLDHKVSHTNSVSIVYATDSTGTDTPVQFTSTNQASTIALRTSTGQLAVTDATEDTHAVGYKQMKTYVSEHGGSGGLSLHKTYEINGESTYTITDSDVWEALVTNQGMGCQVMIAGLNAYTNATQPYGMVFTPYYKSTAYKPTWQYEVPAHIDTGDSNEYIKVILTYDTTNSSIKFTTYQVSPSGTAYSGHTCMYRIEILKF
jgi:hypothetical protein